MSDLSATNCGCGCERNERSGFGNNSCLWIILLLFCCGGCGNGFSGNRSAVETAVSGLSFCYSAVADLEADPTTVVAVAMDSEMAAANLSPKIPAGLTRPEFYFFVSLFFSLFVFTVFFPAFFAAHFKSSS